MAFLFAPTLRRPAGRRPFLLARIPLATAAQPRPLAALPLPPVTIPTIPALPTIPIHGHREFHSSQQRSNHYQYRRQHQHGQKPFFGKLREALKNTKTEWYAIPFGLGVGVVGFTQIRKNSRLEPQPPAPPATAGGQRAGDDSAGSHEHERRVRPMGSWLAPSVSAQRLSPCVVLIWRPPKAGAGAFDAAL